jgi:hypothetical protein
MDPWRRRDGPRGTHAPRRKGHNLIVGNERGQISGWLIRLVVFVGIGGFLLLEFGAVAVNRLQAGDLASEAAAQAGIVYFNTRSLEAAEDEAKEYVADKAELLDVSVDPQVQEISVTLRKTASTILIDRIEALDDVITIEVTESAPLRR